MDQPVFSPNLPEHREISSRARVDSQVENHKIACSLPDMLTKSMVVSNQISPWDSAWQRDRFWGEIPAQGHPNEAKWIPEQLGAKVRWTSLSQISLHKMRFNFLKSYSQIPDRGEESSGIHLPEISCKTPEELDVQQTRCPLQNPCV